MIQLIEVQFFGGKNMTAKVVSIRQIFCYSSSYQKLRFLYVSVKPHLPNIKIHEQLYSATDFEKPGNG